MVIRRINAVSCAKIFGLLYAAIGFLLGVGFALVSLAGGFAASNTNANTAGLLTAFGVGAVIVFPLIYGALGFVMTWIAALIYNLLAGVVGGVQVEVAPAPGYAQNTLTQSPVPSL